MRYHEVVNNLALSAGRAGDTAGPRQSQGVHVRQLELAGHLEGLQIEVINVKAVAGLHEDLGDYPVTAPSTTDPVHVYVQVSGR